MGSSQNMSLTPIEKYEGEPAGKVWQRGRLEMIARHTIVMKNEKFLWDLLEMHCTFDPWMAIGVKCHNLANIFDYAEKVLITWKGHFLDYKERELTAPLPFVEASLIPLNQFRLKANADPEWFREYMNEMKHNDLFGQRFDPAIVLERRNLTYGADHRTWVKKNHELMKLKELYDYRNDISFNDKENMEWQRQMYKKIKNSPYLLYDELLTKLLKTHCTLDVWKAVGKKFNPILEEDYVPDDLTFKIIEYREALIGCPQWAINSLLSALHQFQSHIRICPRWYRGYLKEMERTQLLGIRFHPEIIYGNKGACAFEYHLVVLNNKMMNARDKEEGKDKTKLYQLFYTDEEDEDEEDAEMGEDEQDINAAENGSGE